jgi:hypothetical protein
MLLALEILAAISVGWLLHVFYIKLVNWLAKKYDENRSP